MFSVANEIPGKNPFLYFLHTSGCIMNGSFKSWFLGVSNGSRSLIFYDGNGTSKTIAWNKIGSSVHCPSSTTNGPATSNYDGEGTYLIFNVGYTLFICDFNSDEKVFHIQHILCTSPIEKK